MPFHRSAFANFAALTKTFVTMKRIISISLLAVSAMLGSAQTNINVFTPEDLQPGKPCDTLRYVITYDMAYVEDTLQVPMKAAHETMLLETGRKVTARNGAQGYSFLQLRRLQKRLSQCRTSKPWRHTIQRSRPHTVAVVCQLSRNGALVVHRKTWSRPLCLR